MKSGSFTSSDVADALRMDTEDERVDGVGLPSDAEGIVERARTGDAEAFEQLMILHQHQVLGTALRILRDIEDAKDAAQDVFLRLYRSLPRIRAQAGLRPWLYSVTVNACRDQLRRRTRLPSASSEENPEPLERAIADVPGAESVLDRAERCRILHEALDSLPLKERTALVLRDIEGLSTEETAEILGIASVTVRTHVSKARVRIRHFLERKQRKRP